MVFMFCHAHHYDERGAGSRVVTTDPRMRVSQAERDAVVEDLSRHTSEGRLDLAEFEQRVDEALAAKTRGELDNVLRELPAARPRGSSRPHASPRPRPDLVPKLLIVGVVVGAMLGAPWLLWLLFWLVPAALHA
jgi:Domain of unknown function (DUF1707)